MNLLSLVGDAAKELLTPRTNPVLDRCRADFSTKMRHQYKPYYHVGESNDGVHIRCDGRDMVMMSSNEYLGLSRHPRVVRAAQEALNHWGTSSCGSRLANGSRAYHTALEEELAAFLGREACHVFSAGYLACMSGITGLSRKGDAVILDRNVHACLWDAACLSPATVERYCHEDMDELAAVLSSLDQDQAKLLVVDGVYSMEGHIANLPRICELAREHGAFVIVDDAHGFGVLGDGGRGTCSHHNLAPSDTGLVCGSFSKSVASIGGFAAGDRNVIEFMRSHCRQIIFSAALPPASAAAAREALRVLQDEPEHIERVRANAGHLRTNLDHHGLDYWGSPTPAIPIVIGDKHKCYDIWKSLWEDGFFTVMSISPGVPAGKDLIRCAVSSLHTPEILDRFTESLVRACRKSGVTVR